MRNISDVIEDFLKNIIELSEVGEVEVQRNLLAERFQCVPSQINYVISTRFSIDKGFLVESKRGGGGYIRIKKLEIDSGQSLFDNLYSLIDSEISQASAIDILNRLREEKYMNNREYNLLKTIISRDVLNLSLPYRDEIRSNILKAALRVTFSQYNEEEDNDVM